MLKAALSGNYVNFGVFRLYGDSALDDVLETFVKILLSISQCDLLVGGATRSWYGAVSSKRGAYKLEYVLYPASD